MPRTVSSCRIVPIPAGRASASRWPCGTRESFVASVIREVQEETGLTIQDPILCGVKQFPREDGARYVVLLFRATRFTGTLTSSSEGKMLWLTREELKGRHLTSDFLEMLRVFENPTLSEFYYYQAPGSEEWRHSLL